jgi:hypothetical protein
MNQLVRREEGAVMHEQETVTRKRLPGWARVTLIVAGVLLTLYLLAIVIVLYTFGTGQWG